MKILHSLKYFDKIFCKKCMIFCKISGRKFSAKQKNWQPQQLNIKKFVIIFLKATEKHQKTKTPTHFCAFFFSELQEQNTKSWRWQEYLRSNKFQWDFMVKSHLKIKCDTFESFTSASALKHTLLNILAASARDSLTMQ